MEQDGLVLSQEEFLRQAYEQYKTLTVYDRKSIFDFNRRFRGKEDVPKNTFSVRIY